MQIINPQTTKVLNAIKERRSDVNAILSKKFNGVSSRISRVIRNRIFSTAINKNTDK